MEEKNKKTHYEISVDLIKALAWPLFAVFLLFSFWKPLHTIINELPELIQRSKTVTVAGVVLEINQDLPEPSEEVKTALAKISPEGVQELMRLSNESDYKNAPPSYIKVTYEELIKLGLFMEVPTENLKEDYIYGVQVTQLGRETQEYVYKLLSEFLTQLNLLNNKSSS